MIYNNMGVVRDVHVSTKIRFFSKIKSRKIECLLKYSNIQATHEKKCTFFDTLYFKNTKNKNIFNKSLKNFKVSACLPFFNTIKTGAVT